jgi:PAS domain S-box-containing protein
MPPSEIIVREAPDGILTVSDDYTIDSANQAFYDITGLTPDEVLGRRLAVLFPLPTNETDPTDASAVLYGNLEKLKSGEVKEVQQVEVRRSQEGSGLRMHVTVLVIPDFLPSGKLESFTFVLHDLKEQAAKEAEARALRDRCEQILENAIPGPVFRAMRGTAAKRPTFMTNVATIIQIEFIGLRESVSSMSPSSVMDAVATLFAAFEEVIAKFPAVHCVRWSERSILAICGLFDYSTEIKEQAEQAAQAVLEFRAMKDELNDKLILDLQYKFSIVQGGPVMGAMLNSETPSFNLLGALVQLGDMLCREAGPDVIRINSDLASVLNPVTYDMQTTPKGPRDLMDTIVLHGTRD